MCVCVISGILLMCSSKIENGTVSLNVYSIYSGHCIWLYFLCSFRVDLKSTPIYLEIYSDVY